MNEGYPKAIADIQPWARENGRPVQDAQIRFAQFAILYSIASSTALRLMLVLKGGNALDFVWQPSRSTTDLDFSVDHTSTDDAPQGDDIKRLLEPALAVASRNLGIHLTIHRVRRNPPGEDKTFVTYDVRVGYHIPVPGRVARRLSSGRPSTDVIQLDISINEYIGATTVYTVTESKAVRIATVEDIVAEKLRALLQQTTRNRNRPQDVLDIANVLKSGAVLDRARVSSFLVRKCAARDIRASKSAFRSPDVLERARVGYDALEQTVRGEMIQFDDAIGRVQQLVESLDLPEN